MKALNEKYYRGDDQYSDGDVEEDILKYIQKNEPEEYENVIEIDQRFPVVYHLARYRQHLLDWYSFRKDTSLLEIGGGMGAFTNLFCDRCGRVVTVELSKRRAEAIKARCKKQSNLEIYVGNIMEMELEEKFDYITVLGVLEYQNTYAKGNDPEGNFLRKISSLLKPDGKILIAIENRMGLKYWCGDVEDHCGIPFTGINGYSYGGSARTFDRAELIGLMNKCDLPYQKFYYPLPDYKFPRVIYTDKYLPKENVASCILPNYYAGMFHHQYPVVADERKIYPSISRNQVFPFFANSFLVECAKEQWEDREPDFISTTAERNKQFLIRTVIKGDTVQKEAVLQEAEKHLHNTWRHARMLKEMGVPVIDHSFEQGKVTTPLIHAFSMEEQVTTLIENRKRDEAKKWINSFYALIEKASSGNNKIETEMQEKSDGQETYCDMIFSNAFVVEGEIEFYDQEWVFPGIESLFVLYRALKILYSTNPSLEEAIPLKEWYEDYGIIEHVTEYEKLENDLFSNIQSDAICGFIAGLRYLPENTIKDNLSNLVSASEKISWLQTEMEAYKRGYYERDRDVHSLEKAYQKCSKEIGSLRQSLTACEVERNSLRTMNEAMTARLQRIEGSIPYKFYRKIKKVTRK